MALLEVEGLRAGYGRGEVLHDVDLSVAAGETLVVLGANGAGKTTTLRALSGLIPAAGRLVLDGADLVGLGPTRTARLGVAHVPQGRGTFTDLTVEQNLRVGSYLRKDDAAADRDRWFEVFPRLRERRRQLAGALSGGEQQMLAIARALMMRPRLLLLDEPSLGLAPNTTRDLFATLADLRHDSDVALLIVEQNAQLALGIADHAVLLEVGAVVASGPAAAIAGDDSVRRAYLGY
ncbi:ABC transporter ATP-binding protein [Xylanimonas ulmi]|uniref:Amino acid/amide ABC transporter ATP-binding protein 2 (HAAT family) n=2 Tax=Xylanimonas ulmi TaxID=228973 RepID=A0A4Q7M2Q1_9MICO|nr:ABC transporter ATP-binding protein [Xylanibacterium ulmi]RZS61561.1 amino acid/amide ABC transporter ATP-binding protein 2 (HAAT family) [Xylanibacterium ulmi]